MKIFLLSTPWVKLPPSGFGGTEQVVYNLAQGLKRRNHEVTVFATGDSKIEAELRFLYSEALSVNSSLDKGRNYLMLNHIYKALKSIPTSIDIIHNHCEYSAMHLLDLQTKPFVHTLHGAFYQNYDKDHNSTDNSYIEAVRSTLRLFSNHNYVSISNSQREGLPELNYINTSYNGIVLNDFSFNEFGGDYIAWLGRYTPLKGLDKVFEVGKVLNKPVYFSAYVNKHRQDEFNTKISPQIDGKNIIFNGECKNQQLKNQILSQAKAFLLPIQWEEPFGLVITEAMACGTPVVAFARGSVPEIIKDGETGFMVNPSNEDIRGNWIIKKTGLEGLVEATERIYSMNKDKYQEMRRACYEHVKTYFTVESMLDSYEEVYKQVLSNKTN